MKDTGYLNDKSADGADGPRVHEMVKKLGMDYIGWYRLDYFPQLECFYFAKACLLSGPSRHQWRFLAWLVRSHADHISAF
jgi:hypothetical protein